MKTYNFGNRFDDWVYKHYMFCCFIQHVVHKNVCLNIVFCKKIIMFLDLEVSDEYRFISDNTHPTNQNPMIKRNTKHKNNKNIFRYKEFFCNFVFGILSFEFLVIEIWRTDSVLSVMKTYDFGDWFDDWVYKHLMFCCFI